MRDGGVKPVRRDKALGADLDPVEVEADGSGEEDKREKRAAEHALLERRRHQMAVERPPALRLDNEFLIT